MPNTRSLRATLTANLDVLMAREGLTSDRQLAVFAKMPVSTIRKIRNGTSSATLDSVAMLAQAFRVESWLLLMPGLDASMVANNALGRLVKGYRTAKPDSRDFLTMVAEREATYSAGGTKDEPET